MAAAAVGWLAVMVLATRHQEMIASDDALIVFQYARNLARGYGLVFNQGERVWGFTSPLHTVQLGLLASLGADTVRAGFVTGFLWMAVAAVFLYRLSADVLPRALALSLGLFFLLNTRQHGVYAMESTLLVALQTGFLLAAVRGKGRLANVLAGVSCLARPDSVLLVVPILLIGRETRRWSNLAVFAAIGLLWGGFAYLYYGELVPNSLHAKSGLSSFGGFGRGAIAYVSDVPFSRDLRCPARLSMLVRAMVIVLPVAVLLNRRVRRRPALMYALLAYPWLLVGAYSYIGSALGHNWELYSARFFLHVAAAIGALSLAHHAAAKWRMRPSWRWAAVTACLLLTSVTGAAQTAALIKSYHTENTDHWAGGRYETYRRVTDWVNANLPRGATIAMSEVGTVAYYTDTRIIDVSGIITRDYAPGDRGNHARFLQRFSPAYVLLFGDIPELPVDASLHYRRLAFFPRKHYANLSLLEKDGASTPGR